MTTNSNQGETSTWGEGSAWRWLLLAAGFWLAGRVSVVYFDTYLHLMTVLAIGSVAVAVVRFVKDVSSPRR